MEFLIKKFSWERGRQGTGYNKIRLFESQRFKCDGYLLYYPEGSEIPLHIDHVDTGRHFRLNIMLKKAQKGGDFICENPVFRGWRMFLFRPDISAHAVSRIERGWRLMLSIGWVRP